LAKKNIGGVSQVCKAIPHRGTSIQQKEGSEGLLDGSEECDLLFNGVLENLKVRFVQIGDVSALTIHDYGRNGYEIGFQVYDIIRGPGVVLELDAVGFCFICGGMRGVKTGSNVSSGVRIIYLNALVMFISSDC